MSLQNKDKAELIRLKMKMEIIRTVCPMIMILIQLFIIIHIYQARIMPTLCSTWNTTKAKFLFGFFYFSEKTKINEIMLDFMIFLARGRQQQVNDYFACYPEMCDRFGNQGHSLYFGAGAPVIKRVVFRWWNLRRLYSAKTNLSSLFFSFGAFSLIRAGLLRRSKQ